LLVTHTWLRLPGSRPAVARLTFALVTRHLDAARDAVCAQRDGFAVRRTLRLTFATLRLLTYSRTHAFACISRYTLVTRCASAFSTHTTCSVRVCHAYLRDIAHAFCTAPFVAFATLLRAVCHTAHRTRDACHLDRHDTADSYGTRRTLRLSGCTRVVGLFTHAPRFVVAHAPLPTRCWFTHTCHATAVCARGCVAAICSRLRLFLLPCLPLTCGLPLFSCCRAFTRATTTAAFCHALPRAPAYILHTTPTYAAARGFCRISWFSSGWVLSGCFIHFYAAAVYRGLFARTRFAAVARVHRRRTAYF